MEQDYKNLFESEKSNNILLNIKLEKQKKEAQKTIKELKATIKNLEDKLFELENKQLTMEVK